MNSNIKNLFIVIPVHNRKELTRNCLLSLKAQTIQNFSTVVIDDGSTDGTGEMIQEEFPDVVLLHGDGNLWWAGATNLGVEYALSHAKDGYYVLTLNNDSVVRPDYIQTLHASALDYPKSLIGSISISDEDESTVVDGGVRINWLTAKFARLGRCKQYKDIINSGKFIHPVDVLPGRGTLIPIEAFQKVGLYDFKRLPHYGADYEFSLRAKKNGYKLYIDYRAVIISNVHSTGVNSETINLSWLELAKSFFSIRSPNNLKYRWHFTRLSSPKFLLFTFYLLDIGRVVCGCLRNKLKAKSK